MSLRKLAVFVEGQTELIFVKKLLQEIAGEKNIAFQEISAGAAITLRSKSEADDTGYFALIVDCSGDSQVKTKIIDNREGLIRAGYQCVVGLRDLYPIERAEFAKLKQGLQYGVPTKDLAIRFCIAVMETEAWFIQESTHFERIDPALTAAAIRNAVGYDIETEIAENVAHPADLLRQIYSVVGRGYRKNRRQVERTVLALDYARMYLDVPAHSQSFQEFVAEIDIFLGTS